MLFACQGLNELEFSRENFKKFSPTIFNDNSSVGFKIVPCGKTYSYITNQVFALGNSANSPKFLIMFPAVVLQSLL